MGVSYMAEDSLPGDPLYSVKVRINDGVKHITAIRSEAEARVSAEIIARRAQEARKLAAEGRLDTEAKEHLEKEIQTELKKWNKATASWINDREGSAQMEARAEFESQARVNADILQTLDVSLNPSLIEEASSSMSVYLDSSSVQEDVSSTTEGDLFDTTNINASTSLDARGVINTE